MRPNIREIIAATAGQYQLPAESFLTARRRTMAHPRQVAMYLARVMAGLSLPAIGRAFNRDHTTVIYALKQVEARCADFEQIAAIMAIAGEVTRMAREREARDRVLIASLHIERARLDQLAVDLATACVSSRPKRLQKPVPRSQNGRWTIALHDRRAA